MPQNGRTALLLAVGRERTDVFSAAMMEEEYEETSSKVC
jgi:hypothetical protein